MEPTSQRDSDLHHAPREFIKGAMVAGKGLFMKRLMRPPQAHIPEEPCIKHGDGSGFHA